MIFAIFLFIYLYGIIFWTSADSRQSSQICAIDVQFNSPFSLDHRSISFETVLWFGVVTTVSDFLGSYSLFHVSHCAMSCRFVFILVIYSIMAKSNLCISFLVPTWTYRFLNFSNFV